MAEVRQRLIGLLDYIEQVVRLDERVAFRLSEYHLPDGSTFAVGKSDTHNLPSVRHDHRDEEGAVWLEVERLSRKEPPVPPVELAEWIVLSADPGRPPEVRNERIVTVSPADRDIALAKGEVRPDDVLEAPRKRGEPENAPSRFDLTLRLEDRPELNDSISDWIAKTWMAWSVAEQPRRRTIALYQVLYKIFQLMEVGGSESQIELMWGIGVVHWQKDGRIVDRPLLERRVEIELDDTRGGLIRVRPTTTDALFDLKPYDELGSTNLPNLSDLIRREIQRAGENEGISPFVRESFEPILSAAGARLDPEGTYAPEVNPVSASAPVQPTRLADDPGLCLALANQIRASANSARLAAAQEVRQRMLVAFDGEDRTSNLAQQLISEAIGNAALSSDKISAAWSGIIRRLDQIKALFSDFEMINATTAAISAAGAPNWANGLRHTIVEPDEPMATSAWRDAWDHAAADAALGKIDARQRLIDLAKERDAAEKQCRRLFGEIVRERTFYALDRRLSPAIKAALVEFVRALARIGRGTGKTAWAHRKTARDAMARCYGAVPCWIMPTWRVAEQLPAELGVLDLVIIDEASQSDVTELPALLRGKKILVVGDDRQVSPTAPFVTHEKIGQLRHHYLGDVPFKSLLEPGESIYDLMRAVFPNQRLMLKEHFRCVEPIIRFSMQFYPEKMLPLRIPAARERLDPPLIDIYVPHGARGRNKKINPAEADVIVGEIAALTTKPEMQDRTIGVISLVGKEQAEHIRIRLSEAIGEEIMQRHSILCGDSATFQGSERDIVYLSMVADSANKTALTMLRYEQRFNVAVSRARDRVVLVRSVKREELNPKDLKARLIAHFENPMPEREDISDGLSTCESGFERDLMQRLLDRGYRVQGQVGSLGYRIDMVVEGLDGTRLAVECDGDRFHGPAQWQEDMRRQRTLERVGWRFWRCFASSFYRDSVVVMNDLFEMLARIGIEPVPGDGSGKAVHRFTEHRTINLEPSAANAAAPVSLPGDDADQNVSRAETDSFMHPNIRVGDKVVLVFSDDQKRISARLVDGTTDLEKGRLSSTSPLGRAVMGAEEGDEIELPLENGIQRKVLIESLVEGSSRTAKPDLPTVDAEIAV